MAAGRPASHGTPVTIAQVVGRNVRMAREQRGWDHTNLVDEAAYVDLPWDADAIADIERGTAGVSIGELVSLGVLLGIAPHLLLYPEPGTAVALHASAAEDDGAGLEDVVLYSETHMPAGEFASWIWDPDSHAATHVELAEGELWSRSTTVP